MISRLQGHFWTIYPRVRDTLLRVPSIARPWQHDFVTLEGRPLTLRGLWHEVEGAQWAVMLVHGLGGQAESPYCLRALAELAELGVSVLSLSLRGADRSGQDFYHAGLTEDLVAALSAEEFSKYQHLAIIGFSLGGHVTLRLASEGVQKRVRGFCSICAPLDLAAGCRYIDSDAWGLYRRHVLDALKEIYEPVAKSGRGPRSWQEVKAVETIYEFDSLTVAPRYGYASADDYYADVGVGPHLQNIQTPSLLIAADFDPMVPRGLMDQFLSAPAVVAQPNLTVRRLRRGGHIGFPGAADLELNSAGAASMMAQIMNWLQSQVRD